MRERPPMSNFADWFSAADKSLPQAEAMTLATVFDGKPQLRTVLLKQFDDSGFIFYTRRESRKGQALAKDSHAAILFYWRKEKKQVSAEGNTEEITAEEAAQYFSTRPRESRIAAWASEQSQPIESPEAMSGRFAETAQRLSGDEGPPPGWAGYRLRPLRMEFWEEGENRLHRRLAFFRDSPDGGWQSEFLQP